jgi:hypothetical protein
MPVVVRGSLDPPLDLSSHPIELYIEELTNMTSTKYFSLWTLVILILLVSIGVAMADPMITQTPEIQGFTTGTTMNVVGLAMENDAIGWQLSNGAVTKSSLNMGSGYYQVGPYVIYIPGGAPVTDAMYGTTSSGQVLYTVAYDEATAALNGAVSYNKGLSINTGNQVATQSNVKADKIVTFDAADGGKMTSSEDLLVDGAGQFGSTASKMLCPFAASTSTFIPPFCNIVQTGSSVDLTSGRLVTSSHERTVAATSDPGVEAGHDISVTGIGNGVALGSADAYIKVHVQEGRITSPTYVWITGEGPDLLAQQYQVQKSEDLEYSEFTSASPVIAKFIKSMDYKSGPKPL